MIPSEIESGGVVLHLFFFFPTELERVNRDNGKMDK